MGSPMGYGYSRQGLAGDLLGPSSGPTSTGLAGDLLRGIPGVTQAPPMVADAGQAPSAAEPPPAIPRVTAQNVDMLARVLTGECQGVCNADETQGVGSTVINRMNRDGTDSVTDVAGRHAYALAPKANADMIQMATDLLSGQLTDSTGGATHFYSPRSMPSAGHRTGTADISGGLEQIPGHKEATYRPGFAANYPQNDVPYTDPWKVKFYTQPGNGRVN